MKKYFFLILFSILMGHHCIHAADTHEEEKQSPHIVRSYQETDGKTVVTVEVTQSFWGVLGVWPGEEPQLAQLYPAPPKEEAVRNVFPNHWFYFSTLFQQIQGYIWRHLKEFREFWEEEKAKEMGCLEARLNKQYEERLKYQQETQEAHSGQACEAREQTYIERQDAQEIGLLQEEASVRAQLEIDSERERGEMYMQLAQLFSGAQYFPTQVSDEFEIVGEDGMVTKPSVKDLPEAPSVSPEAYAALEQNLKDSEETCQTLLQQLQTEGERCVLLREQVLEKEGEYDRLERRYEVLKRKFGAIQDALQESPVVPSAPPA